MTGARSVRLLTLLCCLSGLPWAACDLLPSRSPGEKLYRQRCAGCHGLDARGNTPRHMGNATADLTDDSWEHANSEPGAIAWVIENGILGSCPANPDLTPEQARQIADHVLELRRRAGP